MSDKSGNVERRSRITLWAYAPEDGNPRFFLPLPNGELKEISREEAKQVKGRWLGRNPIDPDENEDPEPQQEQG